MTVDDWRDAKETFSLLYRNWLFRGQADPAWVLETSLHRHMTRPPEITERRLYNEFTSKAHQYLPAGHAPEGRLEWLALMQHYGVPTRLLDWTRSPYVAAYFALENAEGDCVVWALDMDWCLRRAIPIVKQSPDFHGVRELSFIDDEQNLFERIFFGIGVEQWKPFDLVVPVYPTRVHERMGIQQGMFLCVGNVEKRFLGNLAGLGVDEIPDHLLRIILPAPCRVEALDDLDQMNVTRTTLFPGLDGFGQYLRQSLVYWGDSSLFTTRQMRSEAIGFPFTYFGTSQTS